MQFFSQKICDKRLRPNSNAKGQKGANFKPIFDKNYMWMEQRFVNILRESRSNFFAICYGGNMELPKDKKASGDIKATDTERNDGYL